MGRAWNGEPDANVPHTRIATPVADRFDTYGQIRRLRIGFKAIRVFISYPRAPYLYATDGNIPARGTTLGL